MLGTGVTVTFETSEFTAELLGVTPFAMSRPAVDTTHLGTTGFKTYEPGDLVDGGEGQLRIKYDPGTTIPMFAVAELITIGMPDSSDGDVTYNAFITGFAIGEISEDAQVEATVTLKITSTVSGTDIT